MPKATVAMVGALSSAMLAVPVGAASGRTAVGSTPPQVQTSTCSAPGASGTSLLSQTQKKMSFVPLMLRSEQNKTYSMKRLRGG